MQLKWKCNLGKRERERAVRKGREDNTARRKRKMKGRVEGMRDGWPDKVVRLR